MIFTLLSILVPIAVYTLLPITLTLVSGKPTVSKKLLIIAGVLYFISWHLPSPLIHGMNTFFTTHFVGGGLFTGFVWLYIKKHLQWHLHPLLELFTLYLLVSGLGVGNELLELLMSELKIAHLSSIDTWWDLLANTTGALVFWIIYKIVSKKNLNPAYMNY